MKTALITGTSSGIGRAAAQCFAQNGWNVVATMRSPEKETELNQLKNVCVVRLNVTDSASIAAAFDAAEKAFEQVDVVVNNAGYGVDGVFEAMTDEVIRRQFDTNVFGLMRVTREAIRRMRPRKNGTIVQIASMGGRLTFPLFSIYHGTKWAVEGFTESLHYELRQFGIKVRLVEPGAINTEFMGRSREAIKSSETSDYDEFVAKCNAVSEGSSTKGESPETVAKAVFKAATDSGWKMRYIVGAPATYLLPLRKLLPESWFFGIVRSSYKS